MEQVTIERDIDQDRFMSYDQFKQFISGLIPLSKNQVFLCLLGVTGWRPCEAVMFKIQDIDPVKKRLRYSIAKAKTSVKGDYLVKFQKIKWRVVPDWFFNLLDSYIKQNYLTMKGGYIFSSRDNRHGDHMTVEGFQIELARIRHSLFNKDKEKWSWLMEYFQVIKYPNGREQKYYKFSLYSFRKMHATYYAQMLQDRGITDVMLHTAHHMGHTKIQTTYQYVKSLIDENKMASGFKKAVDYSFEFSANQPRIDKFQKKLSQFD